MLQVSVSRRQLAIFTTVIALFVSAAWVGVANQARAGSATPVVYVATGGNFPDALGAGPAAAIVKGPLLLVAQNSIPGETAAELTRLAPDTIVIVGGTAVVSAAVEEGLKSYAGTVERIAGANRYDTAAKLSAATYPATIDADTLDGKDSTAFLGTSDKAADSDQLDGKDSTAFLGTSDKAADSDQLDGKDSTAFVEHGAIEMTQSGTAWMVRSQITAGPISVNDRLAHSTVFTGQGDVVIGITGPAEIGGTAYGLASFDLCLFGGTVTQVGAVAINYFGPDADDADIYIDVTVQDGSVDRTTGCYTYTVDTPVGQGIGLQVTLDGTAELFSVKSLWTTAAAG